MKNIFIITLALLITLIAPPNVSAQGNQPPIPPVLDVGNFVLDTLNWLTPEQESEINSINKALDQDGLAQIAVVTLDDCGTDKKHFRHDLFNSWGIGHANDNDGLLILACWYGGDKTQRSIEQEVGYGLENILSNELTDNIAKQYFVTAFQKEQPGNGLLGMVKAYDSLLRKLPTTTKLSDNQLTITQQQNALRTTMIIVGSIITIMLLTVFFVRRRTTHKSTQQPKTKHQSKQNAVTKENTSHQHIGWFSGGYSSDDSSGFNSGSSGFDSSGGGFDGGSSGDSGSSTDF